MTPADRLAALRAVPGCGRDTVLYGQDHLVAIVHAKHCDACFTLLVDAVIAHAVEGISDVNLRRLGEELESADDDMGRERSLLRSALAALNAEAENARLRALRGAGRTAETHAPAGRILEVMDAARATPEGGQ